MAYNILVVDDSPIMRQVIKKTVRVSGADIGEIYEANHGQEGLEQARSNWIDLILTDINMPVMNGVEFIRNLKSDDELKSIPVMVISTEGRDEIVQEAMELGAVDYITKPFRPEEIGEDIVRILG
jgi:two-component system chemotaxis response regulator CheY